MAGSRAYGIRGLLAFVIAVAAALAAFVLAGCQQEQKPPAEFEKAAVEYVVDGDTIDVIADGREKRVRLAGIDAPESASHDESLNTEEGARATGFLRTLLPVGRVVYLQKDTSETDKYNRLVRYVWLEVPEDPYSDDEIAAKMVNSVVVEAGFAQAVRIWPDVAYNDWLKAAQERAAAAGAGVSYLWVEDQ